MVAPDFWHVLVVRPSRVAASSYAGPATAMRRIDGFRCARSARSRLVSALWHLGWPRVAGRLLLSGSAVTLKGRRSPLEGRDWPQGPASRRRQCSPLHEKVRQASGQSSFPASSLPLVDVRHAPVTCSSSQRPQRRSQQTREASHLGPQLAA